MKLLKKIGEETVCVPAGSKTSEESFTVYIDRPKVSARIRAFGEGGDELHTEDVPDREELYVRLPYLKDKYTIALYIESDEENNPWKDYEPVESHLK